MSRYPSNNAVSRSIIVGRPLSSCKAVPVSPAKLKRERTCCIFFDMEVIEISSSDEEEPRQKSSLPDVIVISSSPSDREDSPAGADKESVTLKISKTRLNRLREITKRNVGNRARRNVSLPVPAHVNGRHLAACDSPVSVDSDDDGLCELTSVLCSGESKTENERKVTPVSAHVQLTDIRQPPSITEQSPQTDTEFRQSPLQGLLKDTSRKSPEEETCKKSSAQRNLSVSFYRNIQKSPVKSLSSPKLKQTTLNLDSFSPKRQCLTQPSRGQTTSFVPPQHVHPSGLITSPNGANFFTEAQIIILESLLEEEILQTSFLSMVNSFTTQTRKPTPEIVGKMIQIILLQSRKATISFSCYRTLKIIHALHPDVAACAVEDSWDLVIELLDQWLFSEDDQQLGDHSDIGMTAQNATLALAFVVSVLEVDLKRKQNPKKSKAFRMLSTTSCLQNVEKVVEWIRDVVQLYTVPALHQDSHVIPVCTVMPGCYQDVLSLLQRLLQLSLDVSDMPIGSARRVANGPLIWAYMHPSVSSVESKTLLLESLQSHLLRSIFIELIFQNYCQELTNPHHCGLQRIVSTYFLYMPPSYTVESSACRSQSECEEFVMLLAFLMQSYIFCNTGCFQTTAETALTLEEVETLQDVEKPVLRLQERLEALCNPLSEKTYAFLNLMISLQVFAG